MIWITRYMNSVCVCYVNFRCLKMSLQTPRKWSMQLMHFDWRIKPSSNENRKFWIIQTSPYAPSSVQHQIKKRIKNQGFYSISKRSWKRKSTNEVILLQLPKKKSNLLPEISLLLYLSIWIISYYLLMQSFYHWSCHIILNSQQKEEQYKPLTSVPWSSGVVYRPVPIHDMYNLHQQWQ